MPLADFRAVGCFPRVLRTSKDLSLILLTLWSLIDGGVGIVGGGGWKKSQKLIAGGVGIIGGLEKISEINSRGGVGANFIGLPRENQVNELLAVNDSHFLYIVTVRL